MKKSPPQSVTLALIQMSCDPDPQRNLDKAIAQIRSVAKQGAQVVCLPELFRSQYFCRSEDAQFFELAEAIPGPSTEALATVAEDLKITVIASLFERRAAGLYHNTTVTLSPQGEIVGKYRKMHIPDDPSYYEKFYFTPGDLGFQTFETPVGKMGNLICWDQWYPEGSRITALQGAQVLFYPTAIGGLDSDSAEDHRDQQNAWETIQRAHGIANGVFVAAVNRVGREGEIRFWGGSFIGDPFGRILAKAGEGEENLVVTVDLNLIEKTRQLWPFLRDRRIDAYHPINQRFLTE